MCVCLCLCMLAQRIYPTPLLAFTHIGLFGGPGGLDQQQLLELINQGVLGPLEGGGIGRALAEAGG